MTQHLEIYRKAGEFVAWPANYGMWIWGDEVVVVFSQGFRGEQESLHARDKTRPFIGRQARSFDGGLTWHDEPFTGTIPGGTSLSGDEHVIEALQSQPNIVVERDIPVLDQPIDFTDPETIVMCARTGLDRGSISWFYVSRDRARSWQGPYRLGDFGLPGVSARTDIVPLGQHDALFLLTAVKANGDEGRIFAARTRDGGRSFSFESFVGDEPEGFA
ncbi:MAG: exo-alpha-sialidase, partial [Devosia sp.]|nr:exo-alpha-sialidase [Devosia sp.]